MKREGHFNAFCRSKKGIIDKLTEATVVIEFNTDTTANVHDSYSQNRIL